jgi:hypothetical protein
MSLCFSINRGIYGHVAGEQGGQYIHRLHITDEYTLIFIGTKEYNDIFVGVIFLGCFIG